MNISLPPRLREWVEKRVTSGDYASSSEYVRELVRADQARLARAEINLALKAIEAEADKSPLTPGDWKEIRRAVRERAAARKPRRRAS